MAQVELGITVLIEDTDAERLRRAFGKRLGNPNVTLGAVMEALKQNAIQQIGAVIVAEERNALEDQKAAVKPPVMG